MSDALVVGAGQLGLMMAAAGARFGISVDRIDHVSGEILPGTSSTRIQLDPDEIATKYGVITAELEHLLGNTIVEQLAEHPGWLNGQAMNSLPARDKQKALLDQLSLPTSPWREIHSAADLAAAQDAIGAELVVKSIRDGYDGKGQWLTNSDSDGDIPVEMFGKIIAEQKIDFSRELSIVGARFANGDKYFYPLVENYHQAGMLRYTLAPAADTGSLQAEAERILGKLMDNLDYIGVMAAECFDSAQGLLINEIAPRVHNSGHWTQLGADYSQFDLHLFAILDRQPPDPWINCGPTLMLNLIGCHWNDAWQTQPGIQCYWYGKSFRENRKLGHINVTGNDQTELLLRCEGLMDSLDPFHQEMLGLGMERVSAT